MEYENHLYEILSPNPALVASQLSPSEFAKHYTSGSTRYFVGKVVFAEIDIQFRQPYFKIDEGVAALKPHEDGRPKATKFISSYRVLEHMSFDAIKTLYLASPEGHTIRLEPAPYDKKHQPGYLRVFAEIAPLRMLVLTRCNFVEFGKYITDPDFTKSAPKQFYTQVELDIDEFLQDFEARPTMQPPITGVHPAKLRDAIVAMRNDDTKLGKGLSLESLFNAISYKSLRHGFMFASQEETKFFPMPSLDAIQAMNFRFWRAM